MANGPTHKLVGGAVGLAVSLIDSPAERANLNLVASVAAGTFFAALPDIIEPATNPHHRQFCHSVVVFCAIGYGIKKAYHWKPLSERHKTIRTLSLIAGCAYLSHLVLDASTPRSLPLIGKL